MKRYGLEFSKFDEKAKEEKKNIVLFLILHVSLYVLLIFFAIFFCWYTYFVSTHKFYEISGASMEPTFSEKGDAVYVNRLARPALYDVIVINRVNADSFIKRLMAEEGDWITIAEGQTEDGEKCFYFYRFADEDLGKVTDLQARVDESSGENGYVIQSATEWYNKKTTSSLITLEGQSAGHRYASSFYTIFLKDYVQHQNDSDYEFEFNYYVSDDGLLYVQVPEGKFFFMGDNRAVSADSREMGFFNSSSIVGKTEIVLYDYNFVDRLWEVVKFYFAQMETFFAR